MADFRRTETPAYGVCLACGTAQHPQGFMDLISETNIVRENYEIAGTVDVVLCYDCIQQAGMTMGMINTDEANNLHNAASQAGAERDKAIDEAAAWQQRYENIVEVIGMMQIKGRDDNSEYIASGGATGEPSADLRIPEGESPSTPSVREKQRAGRKPRARANG